MKLTTRLQLVPRSRKVASIHPIPHTRGQFYFFTFYFLAFCSFLGWGETDKVHLVRRPVIGLLYQPRMIHDDECGAAGGMRIGRGNQSTRRKPDPMPLCPPQIPHDLTYSQTRVAALGSRGVTAWTMARHTFYLLNLQKLFEMRSFMFNAQLRTLWRHSTNWMAGLNPNISATTRGHFSLTGFCGHSV
jgi:hypothetical protein